MLFSYLLNTLPSLTSTGDECACSCAGSVVASFQVLMHGRRKKSQVHTVCACSVPQGFLGLEISVKSVTLTSARYADFSHIKKCLSPTALCVDNDEGATRVLSSSLAGIAMHLWIPAKHFSTCLKFTDHFEWSNADCYLWRDIVFKTARMSLRMSTCITMQCGLSAGKQNWP